MIHGRNPLSVATIALGALLWTASLLGAQAWVDSFGTDTEYRPPRYLSGYGVSDLADRTQRLQAARSAALAQLSRQVRVQVTSEESIRTADYGDGQRNRYTNAIQTVSDLQISGATFEIEERRRETHALAWIEIDRLRAQFETERRDARTEISTLIERFDRSIDRGDLTQAEQELTEIDTAFAALTDATAVVRALDTLAGRNGNGGAIDPVAIQTDLELRRDRLRAFRPADTDQAATHLARLLIDQLPTVERVTPLLYEDADFSSAFGSRFASRLERALLDERRGPEGDGAVVVRGSYWPEDEVVAIHVVARDIETGRAVAAAQTEVPIETVTDELRPANMDEALESGAVLLNEQIVNGGLDLDVWTDKGREERALVYEEGEFVQFYFRVNQPAFLRLSYVLASGDTVLLEEQFYIGIDRVNRVVALPYRFQVVPPFGVERLVVTAHTTAPPPADVGIRRIDGQPYQVFRSVGDAVVRTRGLVRESPPEGAADTRVAEASLSITTTARSAE